MLSFNNYKKEIVFTSIIWGIFISGICQEPWPRHTIDASSSGADGVKLADINRDGRLDIVTGWEEGGITKVYLQPLEKVLRTNWPSVIIGKTPNVEDAVFMDMNGDGLLDVISSTEGKTRNLYVHINPEENILDANAWKTEIIPASADLMMWMYAQPIEIDGKHGIDFVAAGKGKDGAIGWFQAPRKRASLSQWKWHKLSDMGWVMSTIVWDIDEDGDQDILVTDRKGELRGCRWLENPGKRKLQKEYWKSHMVGGNDKEVMFMTIADLNMDNNLEIILVERTTQTILIFKSINIKNDQWDVQTIPLPKLVGTAKSVEIGDVNLDGIQDLVISTNTYGPGKHGLFWINGKELDKPIDVPEFQTISGIHNAKYDKVELLDLDKDGDLDVLICEENYGENSEGLGVIWYENTHIKR